MNGEEIQNRVMAIIRDVLDDQSLVVTRETTADDVEDWDSLAHISIIIAIEKEFGIKFNLEELKPMDNLGGLLDVLQSKMAGDTSVSSGDISLAAMFTDGCGSSVSIPT